jgi:hypothetical protein
MVRHHKVLPRIPSPACGGGLGWGRRLHNPNERFGARLAERPRPAPPPHVGEGDEQCPERA